ncbi:hypothetical protein B0H14DRAFT_3456535 [Mycena olivaceomarginata]|nr:hypothetical protein B0H14DRAFT_3456535 [Mycena olivaceomarginata]
MSLSQSPPPAHRRRSSASPSPSTGSVQVVTRKVIRTLEGLGHAIEDVPDDEHHEMEDETEVAAALRADKRQGKQRAQPEVKKIDWEIPRKVFHSSIGFITLGLYLTPSIAPRTVTVVLWSALAVIAPTDVVRLRVPAVERVYERLLGFLMRESERTGTNGTLWYILGCNFALTFYPIDVATVSILMCVSSPLAPRPSLPFFFLLCYSPPFFPSARDIAPLSVGVRHAKRRLPFLQCSVLRAPDRVPPEKISFFLRRARFRSRRLLRHRPSHGAITPPRAAITLPPPSALHFYFYFLCRWVHRASSGDDVLHSTFHVFMRFSLSPSGGLRSGPRAFHVRVVVGLQPWLVLGVPMVWCQFEAFNFTAFSCERPAARFSSPYLHVVVMYLPPRGGLGERGSSASSSRSLSRFGKSTEVETRFRSFSFPDLGLPRAAGWVDCFGVRVSYFWRFWHLSLP